MIQRKLRGSHRRGPGSRAETASSGRASASTMPILPHTGTNVKPSANGYNRGLSQLLDQSIHRCESGGGWRDWAIRRELEKLIPTT